MMKGSTSLKQYCNGAERLVCYGAGEYACIVTAYLQSQGMMFDAYCTTDQPKREMIFGRPLQKVSMECGNGSRIVIAVAEKHHAQILQTLASLGVEEGSVFCIKKEDILELIRDERIAGIAFQLAISEHDTGKSIPKEIDSVLLKHVQHFNKIEIRYWSHTFGSVQMEQIYYAIGDELDKDTYYLIYPYWCINMDMPLTFPNSYMISSFQGRNYSVLSPEKLSTWKLILKKNIEKVFGNMMSPLRGRLDEWQMRRLSKYGRLDIKGKPALAMTEEELVHGKKLAEKNYGIKEPFILIFSRESKYLQEAMQQPGYISLLRDDMRAVMDGFRNSRIIHYSNLIDNFAQRGIQVVRYGRSVMDSLHRDNLIDYGSIGPTDFMDFYLNHQCLFIIGDGSGAIYLSTLYQTPSIMVNTNQLSIRYDGVPAINKERDLLLFQKFYDTNRKRYLSLREILQIENKINANLEYGIPTTWPLCKYYQEHQIVSEKNTPQELLAVATEMLEKVQGTIVYTKEDIELQNRYEQIADEVLVKTPPFYILQARLGRDWLRENADWFLA